MKPKTKIIPPQSPAMGPDVGENDLFPRCQHPDERSARQFFNDLGMKVIEKRMESGDSRFDMRNFNSGRRVQIVCLQDGQIFKSMGAAERYYRLIPGAIQKKTGNLRHVRSANLWFEVLG